MIELTDGIYRFGKIEENSRERPLVLVHPFFKVTKGIYKTLDSGNYLDNLYELIKNHDEEIILFEQKNEIFRSSEKIVKLREGNGINSICTFNNSPKLLGVDYESIFSWLSGKSPINLNFAGGYLEICLKDIYDSFSRKGFNVTINKKVVFSSDVRNYIQNS